MCGLDFDDWHSKKLLIIYSFVLFVGYTNLNGDFPMKIILEFREKIIY